MRERFSSFGGDRKKVAKEGCFAKFAVGCVRSVFVFYHTREKR